jgi:hypothetical protein
MRVKMKWVLSLLDDFKTLLSGFYVFFAFILRNGQREREMTMLALDDNTPCTYTCNAVTRFLNLRWCFSGCAGARLLGNYLGTNHSVRPTHNEPAAAVGANL